MNKHPQDCGNGVEAMPGNRGAGRRGLHTADDRVSTEFQGETVGTGAMNRVREGSGKWVTCGAPPNPERNGKREGVIGGQQGIQGR